MSFAVDIELRLGAERRLSLRLEGGLRPTAVVGPNGAGKSTLLRAIAGANRPEAGTIRLGDALVFDSARGIDQPPERRRVAYQPQGYGLFPHLDVLDNVAFAAPQRSKRGRRRAAAERLEALGLSALAQRRPGELSGGEQQRVALARALMIEPRILLLDEPLAALDVSARRALRETLASHLAATQLPAIVVTHDVRDIVALGCEVAVLEGEGVLQRGDASELAAAPASDFVAELFSPILAAAQPPALSHPHPP